jgi:hypothetical protein
MQWHRPYLPLSDTILIDIISYAFSLHLYPIIHADFVQRCSNDCFAGLTATRTFPFVTANSPRLTRREGKNLPKRNRFGSTVNKNNPSKLMQPLPE